jgi:hypothetical protein
MGQANCYVLSFIQDVGTITVITDYKGTKFHGKEKS